MRKPKVPFLLAFFLVCFAPASGQSDERAPKPSPAAVSAPASSAASPSAKTPGAGQAEINESEYPSVVAANNHVRTTTWAEVEGPVTIALQDFSQWAGRKKVDPNDLRLYLAGRMIPNLEPTMVVWSQEYVNFDLKLTPREILVAILTAARRAKNHSIPMSIGLKDEKQPFPSERFLILQVYPKWAPFCWAGLAALIVVLVLLGWRTTMLRDTLAAGPPLKAPFSLARFQMVCWFAVVVVAYLYIWALTGEYNAPTGSVLALIGISSATGLAAIVVDNEKQSKRESLIKEADTLNQDIARLTALHPAQGSPEYNDLQQESFRLNQVNVELASSPKRAIAASHGIHRDLISDADGVSFHRFQMLIWTVVLVFIFIRTMYRTLAMPEFDPALLGLMGISSGTYLGFKFPEKQK